MSYQDILIGCSNEFTVTSADSFSCKIVSNNLPLLVEHATGYYSRIKMDAIPETQRAVGFLNKEIVDQESIQNYIYVTSGDIVVLSNKTVLHKKEIAIVLNGMEKIVILLECIQLKISTKVY